MDRPIDVRMGGESELVPAGRYLAYIANVVRSKSMKGTQCVKLETVVRADDGKHDVHFYVYWMRKDGSRIKRGCELLGGLAKHAGLNNHEVFHPEKLKGKVVVLTLEVEESEGKHPSRNSIERVEAAIQSPTGDYVIPGTVDGPPAAPADPPREPGDDDDDDSIPF